MIKTRLQIQGELMNKGQMKEIKYKGFLRGGFRIFHEEGIAGLYKGYVVIFFFCLFFLRCDSFLIAFATVEGSLPRFLGKLCIPQ